MNMKRIICLILAAITVLSLLASGIAIMVSAADNHHVLQSSETTLGEAFRLSALGSPRSLLSLRV